MLSVKPDRGAESMNILLVTLIVIVAALIVLRATQRQPVTAVIGVLVAIAIAVGILMAAEQGNVNVDINIGSAHTTTQPPSLRDRV